MLPSTHVYNLARCSIVWNAKTPFLVIPRFVAKAFPLLYDVAKKFTALYSFLKNDCRMIVFDRTFSYCFFSRRLFTQILQLSDLGG